MTSLKTNPEGLVIYPDINLLCMTDELCSLGELLA